MLKPRAQLLMVLIGTLLVLGAGSPALAQGSGNGEQVRNYIERTGEILEIAADVVSDAPNPRSIRILEEARFSHQTSIELSRSNRHAMAYTHSKRARDGAQQAARIAREMAGNTERLQHRLERYMELRERVGEQVRESGDERAMRFLNESEQQARWARDLQQQCDANLALQVLKGAEDLLGRAARIAFEGGGRARLERAMERTRAFIDRVGAEVGDDPAAEELLTSAKMALTRAQEAAANGRVLQALNSLELARRLASRASASDESLDDAAVRRQLERFDQRFERVRARVEESDAPQAQQALERARVHRERAGDLLDNGKLEAALRQIKAGFDLLGAANGLAG